MVHVPFRIIYGTCAVLNYLWCMCRFALSMVHVQFCIIYGICAVLNYLWYMCRFELSMVYNNMRAIRVLHSFAIFSDHHSQISTVI